MSAWTISLPWIAAVAMRVLTVVNFATGAKVSVKSRPSCWVYPFVTNLALYRAIVPSAFSLSQNIHLLPITFLPGGSSVSSQVLFAMRVSYSSIMALVHSSVCLVSLYVCGVMCLRSPSNLGSLMVSTISAYSAKFAKFVEVIQNFPGGFLSLISPGYCYRSLHFLRTIVRLIRVSFFFISTINFGNHIDFGNCINFGRIWGCGRTWGDNNLL